MTGLRTEDDRGVSVAITHVLTIAITTILIATLLTGASGLLDSERDRSAESSLETVGERLAGEIANVDQIAADEDTGSVNITATHPRTVANTGYTVELQDGCESQLIDDETDCLQLSGHDVDVMIHVPITTETGLDDGSSVSGGTIEIVYDADSNDKISLKGAN